MKLNFGFQITRVVTIIILLRVIRLRSRRYLIRLISLISFRHEMKCLFAKGSFPKYERVFDLRTTEQFSNLAQSVGFEPVINFVFEKI